MLTLFIFLFFQKPVQALGRQRTVVDVLQILVFFQNWFQDSSLLFSQLRCILHSNATFSSRSQHAHLPAASHYKGWQTDLEKNSKRTKRWHPEPVKAEKSFEYIPYLMATILKARLDDKATAERVLSLPEGHPRHLAPTIALRESPELIDLVQEYQSRFQSKIVEDKKC